MLVIIILGILLGAVTLHSSITLPHFTLILMVFWLSLGLLVGLTFISARKLNKKMVILFIPSILVGWGWAGMWAHLHLQWKLPIAFENKIVEIKGKVVGIPIQDKNGVKFDAQIIQLDKENIHTFLPVKFRLRMKTDALLLKEGDSFYCAAKLKSPWHFANPGSFDQEKQWLIEGIRAQGTISQLHWIAKTTAGRALLLRHSLNERITVILENKPFKGVIQALTLGLRHNITPKQWNIFQATGTSHIVAISGLHIGLVALFFYWCITMGVRRFYTLTNIRPASDYGAIAAILSAFIYAYLAGFSIPTQRSLIMITLIMLMNLLRKQLFSINTLLLALLAVLIMNPFAPLQMGFWLSFGCVAALILGQSHYQGAKIKQMLTSQMVVFIALIPLSVFYFQQIPLVSPLANLFFIPIMSFIVVPLCLLGLASAWFPVLAQVCFNLADLILSYSWKILEILGGITHQQIFIAPPNYFKLILTLFSVLLLLLPKGLPARNLGWIGLFTLFFPNVKKIEEGNFRFTLLDVGQGLASVIQTHNHVLLFDVGPDNKGILLPFLYNQGIFSLDKIMISHGDLDHKGALNTITHLIKNKIITSEPERIHYPAEYCYKGMHWNWDGVDFSVLHPPLESAAKRNNRSCVLKVSNGYHSVLLTGDIEKEGEKELVKSYSNLLKSDILIVPHHGSLTSSSSAFINAVYPIYALYPVGKNNQYHLPKSKVIDNYSNIGGINLLVWQTGALIFNINTEEELTPPIHWRDTSRYYWHS